MKLNLAEITQRLEELEGWEFGDDKLIKSFEFNNATNATVFVGEISNISESVGHYPKIIILKNHVTVELFSDNGISAKDFEVAHQIDLVK